MTIGPLVPGSPTTVTPDLGHAGYTSVQGPAPDGAYVTDDLLEILQVALNVQAKSDRKLIYTNISDLATITDVAAGWIADVTGYGRYVATTSSLDYGSPWVIVSSGTAGIYWVNLLATQIRQTATGVSSESRGICRIGPMSIFDPSTPVGRIPKSVVQNHVAYQSALARATFLSVTMASGVYLDPPVALLGGEFTAAVGDQVVGVFGPVLAHSWASDYAEFQVSLLQDVNNENGGPLLNVMARARIKPASPTPSQMTVTVAFNQTVSRAGLARVQLDAGAGNGSFDIEGMDNTTYRLGSLTVYRP